MPPAVAAIVAAATAISAAIGGTVAAVSGSIALGGLIADVAFSAVEVSIYAGIGLLAELAFAPKIPPLAAVQDPLKQAIAARKSAFGRVRVSGVYALFAAKAEYSLDVLALLDGRSQAFVAFYLNDDVVTVDGATGAVYVPGTRKFGGGPPGHKVFLHSRLGLATETAYSEITAKLAAWDSAHRGDGVTSLALICEQSKAKDQAADFPNGLPQPSAVIDSQRVFDPRDEAQTQGTQSTYAYSENPVLCLLAYLTDASGGMGEDYSRRIAPALASWIAAADDCDASEATDGQNAVVEGGAAAGDHTVTLSNVAGLAGGVVISFPAETATVLSVAGSIVTLTAGLGFAEPAGTPVTWAGSGVEPRYRCAGVYQHDNAPGDVIGKLLETFDGFLAERGDGALVLYSGRYAAPTVTLTDRQVMSYSVQHFLPDEQAINQFMVGFTDPFADFNTGDAGIVQDDADIATRGVIRSQQLGLDWVPSASQAVRLAKRKLSRAVQPLRGTITANLMGFAVLGERLVRLQIAENAALTDLVVELTGPAQIDLGQLTVTFPWVAADVTVDDGDPGTGVTVPGIPTPRPSNAPLTAPAITALTPVYDDSGAGIAGARILIDVSAPVTGNVQWLVRWRVAGFSPPDNWTENHYADIDDGAAVQLLTGFVQATGDVEVEVAYATAAQTSPWSATESLTLAAPVAAQPYGFAFERDISGIVTGKTVRYFDSPVAWALPAGLADCQGTIGDSTTTPAAAPSADTAFDLRVDGVSIGSMTFASGSLVATFAAAAGTAVALGHVTSIVAPASLHGMAGTLFGSIKGTR